MATIKSIEEKARRYDEAIKTARKINSGEGVAAPPDWTICEVIFPELKESEDERIRKEMIETLKNEAHEFPSSIIAEKSKSWIAYLEKQGEQKPAYTKEYDFHGIKFIPKFAKGDIIKDKKCGEVSTIKDFSYDTGLYTHTYGQFPITIQDNYEIIAQKPAWSEEDEKMLNDILMCGERHCYLDAGNIAWLKSLKDRYAWKPSNEQMNALSVAIKHGQTDDPDALKKLLEQLKKHYL